MATKTLEENKTAPIDSEGGDHDTFAHYVKADELERAMLDGVPCTALCGKKWIPQKDHTKYPVCPTCKDLWEQKE